jgi:hypothetical protein
MLSPRFAPANVLDDSPNLDASPKRMLKIQGTFHLWSDTQARQPAGDPLSYPRQNAPGPLRPQFGYCIINLSGPGHPAPKSKLAD